MAYQAPSGGVPGFPLGPVPAAAEPRFGDDVLAPAACAEDAQSQPVDQQTGEVYRPVPPGAASRDHIVAQTETGIVIVDQHAAHERLVYERMKAALVVGIARQGLLIPEVVELEAPAVDRLAARAEEFAELGLVLEAFGTGAVIVREVPAMLGMGMSKASSGISPTISRSWGGVGVDRPARPCLGDDGGYTPVLGGRRLGVEEMNAPPGDGGDAPACAITAVRLGLAGPRR